MEMVIDSNLWTKGQLGLHKTGLGGMVFFFTVLLPGKMIQVVCNSPVEAIKSEEVDSALQTVDLNEEGEASPEPTEVKLRREERRPPRTSLMTFLRQMVSPLLPPQKD